ncbi:MAG: diacylglycerol kinase family protein [Roseiarcus sp.]|jgi:YegS/Rv2252/BmrU family lipid kinase
MAPPPLEESAGPTCILNGASAHVEAARALLERISGEFGAPARILITRRGDEPASLAARAVDERSQLVVAGGGDGTVNAVASALAGTDTALGVLPMGTFNHFARDVGIPLDLEAAVRNLFTGQIRKVDVGEVNGRVFVNNSGIGLYPRIVRQREAQQRHGHVKWVAFLLAVGSVLRRYSPVRVKLSVDEAETLARRTPFLFVGNNKYGLVGLEIGTRANLDSGRLWVCMASRAGRRNLIRMALKTPMGRESDRELDAFEAQEIWVHPETKRVNVSTDGEISMMGAPLHYRIRPRALGVVAPARNGERP